MTRFVIKRTYRNYPKSNSILQFFVPSKNSSQTHLGSIIRCFPTSNLGYVIKPLIVKNYKSVY